MLFEELEDENLDDFEENKLGEDNCVDENNIIIMVSDILLFISEDVIVNYFENLRRFGGGEVFNFYYIDDGEVIIIFFEVKGMCDSVFCFLFNSVYVLFVMGIKESFYLVEKIGRKWRLKIVIYLVN